MTDASWKFQPPLWATTGLVIACGAFIVAGLWQLDRAEEKRRLFGEFDASAGTAVLHTPVSDDEAESYRYRPLRLSGRYDSAGQFLLDNMVHNGRAGYHVLTPLVGGDRAILVNRGWVPANADRSVLPDVTVDESRREVSGRIAPLPRPGLRLDAEKADPAAPWPRRLSFPLAEEVGLQLGYAVTGYQLLLNPEHTEGFVRDWRPTVMSPEKHLSYAVQWFGLAVALLCIYIVVNLEKQFPESGSND